MKNLRVSGLPRCCYQLMLSPFSPDALLITTVPILGHATAGYFKRHGFLVVGGGKLFHVSQSLN